ncbi:MAG: DsrE family protein [Dehalococcoidales bacterium]|nr:DsrE family protein [Dehalococcoidales bacterium]
MKLAIIINSNDAETAWNALRLANESISQGNETTVFLLGSGVEVVGIKSETFNIAELGEKFLSGGGNLLACGTCLKSREQEAGVCSISTMSQLVEVITGSDKLVTFG